MVNREELLAAYAQKESSEQALAELEKLKSAGSVDEAEYLVLQARHNDAIDKARQTLKSLRIKLRKELNSKSREIEECKTGLSLLDDRLNKKEISLPGYDEQAGALKAKVAQLEGELPGLQLLVDSRSSADMGTSTISPSTGDAGQKEPEKMPSEKEKPVGPVSKEMEKSPAAGQGKLSKIARRHPVAFAIAGICVTGFIIWGVIASQEKPLVCPAIGSPAPEITLAATDGKNISLTDYKGKIVMLYFWNFDCPPCDREIWNVMAVYDKWAKRDFVVLAINEQDAALTASEYSVNRKLPFPVLLDRGGAMKKLYCLPGILPVSIVIDGEGIINTIKTGAFEGTEPLERIVRSLAVQKGIDIEPPLISNVAVSGVGEESAVITWVTNEPATTQIEVSIPEGFPSPGTDTSLLRNHSVTLRGLKPIVTYQFKIIARDGSGNEAILADKSQVFITLASIPVGPEIGKRAPGFTLPTLDGKSITLADLKGKIVMVNFWSKSCASCLREIPHMQAVYDKKLSDKFVMLAIHITEDSENLQDFVSRWKITFPVLVDDHDKALTSYQLAHYPMSYFVDGQGIVRQIKDGLFTSPADIENIINPLLKNP